MNPPHDHAKELEDLCLAFLQLKTVEECRCFLHDLLSQQELVDIPKRWAIVQEVNKDIPQRAIADKFKCGIFTVTRANTTLKYGASGFKLVLDRLHRSRKPRHPNAKKEV